MQFQSHCSCFLSECNVIIPRKSKRTEKRTEKKPRKNHTSIQKYIKWNDSKDQRSKTKVRTVLFLPKGTRNPIIPPPPKKNKK